MKLPLTTIITSIIVCERKETSLHVRNVCFCSSATKRIFTLEEIKLLNAVSIAMQPALQNVVKNAESNEYRTPARSSGVKVM